MTFFLLFGLLLALVFAVAVAWLRRVDLRQQREAVLARSEASQREQSAAPLQVPVIDLGKCLGCGTCVRECPEQGVLALVHGQAAVVNAAACVGHARCVSECPASAVTLSRGDLAARHDVPILDDDLQAIDVEGMFLVGEITARSLIRVAATQGAAVAEVVARRVRTGARTEAVAPDGAALRDAVIVGAGPGGLACALGMKRHGLDFELVDQESTIGGTVAKYPHQKLVLTDEIDLPLHGRLSRREYAKEELVALWQTLVKRHQLPFRGGVSFDHAERLPDGTFVVHTDRGDMRARNVVLAVGRRGAPRRLAVDGEHLPHVTYSLVDAADYRDRRCVVVGGGDSAAETALALAEQPGNQVTIVHRQPAFSRLRSKNLSRIQERIASGSIEAIFGGEVAGIGADHVDIVRQDDAGGPVALQLQADHVFVMVGGVPPFQQLERSGVSFDPARRPVPTPAQAVDSGAGLLPAVALALLVAVVTFCFVVWHSDYYLLHSAARAADPKHALLRPDRSLGLWFGLSAGVAVTLNLAYLLRRQRWLGVRFGQLSSWMNVHVGTGVVALLLAMLHAAMAPRSTPGGYAFWALVVLLVTGTIGRWFYAWLPRATNGRELELDALRAELSRAGPRTAGSEFAAAVNDEVRTLIERRQWHSTWCGRVLVMIGVRWDMWRTGRRIRALGAAMGAGPAAVATELARARTAHAAAIALAHIEDLRAVLGSWRWLHRWLALLMFVLLAVHIVTAVLHGAFAGGGGL